MGSRLWWTFLINEGQNGKTGQFLQRFCKENCDRIEKQYRQVGDMISKTISEVGVSYLFIDGLKKSEKKLAHLANT
jgi:hypothetical protein